MDVCWAVYETYIAQAVIGGREVPVWQAWGYDSWQAFVGIELGLHFTTAYGYRRIWETFYVKLAGSWDTKNLLPLTKMRILCAAKMDKRNVNTWLRKAKTMTCSQLVAAVYGTEELHTFVASVTGSELTKLQAVIDEAREAFGNDLPRGEVLVKIAEEWHAMLKNTTRGKAKLRLVS